MNPGIYTTDSRRPIDARRVIVAALMPLAAFALAWFFWAAVQPNVWFIFFPAVFFSSLIGGKQAGFAATAFSTVVVWWFFIPLYHSFALERPSLLISIGTFAAMGVLVSLTHDYLRKANQQAAAALADARSANDGLEVQVQERTADLRQANVALRTSEDHLRRLYDSDMLGLIFWNTHGAITDANHKFLKMVGYDQEDLKAGRIDWVNLTPPEYRHLDVAAIEALRATGVQKMPFEKEYIRKDGTRFPVILSGAMLDEAREDGVAFVLDITERKQAEEALRESEERFRLVQDHSPDGFTILRPIRNALGSVVDFTWVYENATIARLNGTDPKARRAGLARCSARIPTVSCRC